MPIDVPYPIRTKHIVNKKIAATEDTKPVPINLAAENMKIIASRNTITIPQIQEIPRNVLTLISACLSPSQKKYT